MYPHVAVLDKRLTSSGFRIVIEAKEDYEERAIPFETFEELALRSGLTRVSRNSERRIPRGVSILLHDLWPK